MAKRERFKVSVRKGVARVTLCAPNDGNRFDSPMAKAYGEALLAAGEREDVKVVVLSGEGDDFCLGRTPPTGPLAPHAKGIRDDVAAPMLSVLSAIRATPVPVVVVVQGQARGFGCSLAGHGDITLADTTARFSMPEMGFHLPPTLAMSGVLNRMPAKAVSWMVYTRDEYSAERAFQLGIISELVDAGQLDRALKRLLDKLADRDRAALCAVKTFMQTGSRLDDDAAADLGANLIATVVSSQPPRKR
jgi:enoyl-CoA hydratase/carnithine racemase